MLEGKTKVERSAIVRAFLSAQFPECFCPNNQPKKPLKIGIDHDIRKACPQISRRDISRALHFYTTRPSYVLGLTEGSARYDLAGHVSGYVTQTESDLARQKAQKYHHSVKEKWRKRFDALAPPAVVEAA